MNLLHLTRMRQSDWPGYDDQAQDDEQSCSNFTESEIRGTLG